MDRETPRSVSEILETLEERLLARIVTSFERSPETLFDELAALNLVLELGSRLRP